MNPSDLSPSPDQNPAVIPLGGQLGALPVQAPAEPTSHSEDPYVAICARIVKEQSQIIGLLASEQANRVPGLHVDPSTYACTITGDGLTILEQLVNKYRDFFGEAAVEVCREAASHFVHQLPEGALPSVLR